MLRVSFVLLRGFVMSRYCLDDGCDIERGVASPSVRPSAT
jgi:hypothetical protein